MGASSTLSFDQTPPRRPALDDVGGAAYENDPEYPPDTTMPSAESYNQATKIAVATAAVVPVGGVSVRFNAGAPIVDLSVQVRSVAAVLTLTDNGAGDTSVTWPTDSFPPPALQPVVSLNEDLAMLAPVVTAITNGYRVKTRNSAGTLTDCAFTLHWY